MTGVSNPHRIVLPSSYCFAVSAVIRRQGKPTLMTSAAIVLPSIRCTSCRRETRSGQRHIQVAREKLVVRSIHISRLFTHQTAILLFLQQRLLRVSVDFFIHRCTKSQYLQHEDLLVGCCPSRLSYPCRRAVMRSSCCRLCQPKHCRWLLLAQLMLLILWTVLSYQLLCCYRPRSIHRPRLRRSGCCRLPTDL